MRILIVEDDEDVSEELRKLFVESHLTVDVQHSYELGLEALRCVEYDVAIVDLGLPDGYGIDLITECQRELGRDKSPPFLILTAESDPSNVVTGLKRGAIDYIVKPYNPQVLLARVMVSARMKRLQKNNFITHGNLTYDDFSKVLTVNGAIVDLQRKQMIVFEKLFSNLGRVISHTDIENAAYGFEDNILSGVIPSQLTRLRRKLEAVGANVEIKSVRYLGYIMKLVE